MPPGKSILLCLRTLLATVRRNVDETGRKHLIRRRAQLHLSRYLRQGRGTNIHATHRTSSGVVKRLLCPPSTTILQFCTQIPSAPKTSSLALERTTVHAFISLVTSHNDHPISTIRQPLTRLPRSPLHCESSIGSLTFFCSFASNTFL